MKTQAVDKNWYIKNVTDNSLWNNDEGWVDYPWEATFFTEDERGKVFLPIDGAWIKIEESKP